MMIRSPLLYLVAGALVVLSAILSAVEGRPVSVIVFDGIWAAGNFIAALVLWQKENRPRQAS